MKPLQFYKQQDKVSFFSSVFAYGCVIFMLLIFLLTRSKLPSQIPLFYSLSWGQPQLAETNQLIILPSTLMLIILINSIIALQLHDSQLSLKRIIKFVTAIIAFLFLVSAFRIITIFV